MCDVINQDQTDKLLDLLAKEQDGSLTDNEREELATLYLESTPAVGMATPAQKEYIETLLDKLTADITQYMNKEIDSLTFDEASDLIDELKDDVIFYDAWED